MASETFDFVAGALEQRTLLETLEARGTVRIALKAAGLDAKSVTPTQMAAVLTKLMPGELRARGIDGAEALCAAVCAELTLATAEDAAAAADSPEEIFRRLGRR